MRCLHGFNASTACTALLELCVCIVLQRAAAQAGAQLESACAGVATPLDVTMLSTLHKMLVHELSAEHR